jgi:hypothetical protein
MNYLPVGGYETQSDGNYTMALPRTMWGEGLYDSNNVAEVTICARNNA